MSIQQNFPAISPSLNLNFARSKTLDPRITFSRTSTATRVNEQGLVEVMSADIPRFDHKYENGVIKSLGLLVEEQRSNLVTYSEKIGGLFSSYGWANQNSITVDVDTTDVSDPSGGNSASKLTNGSSSPVSQTLKTCSLSATVYTASVYLRTLSGTETASFNVFLQSSPYTTIATSGVLTITSEWRRYDITTSTATSANYNFGIQVRSGTIYAWGAQLEAGAFPTSYIPTSGSTATRNPDVVTMTGDNFSDWYNQSEGSVRIKTKVNQLSDGTNKFPYAMQIDDGTGDNIILIDNAVLSNGNIRQLFAIRNTGTTITSGMGNNNDYNNLPCSFAYSDNDFAFVNGAGTLFTDDDGIVPKTMNRLQLGNGIGQPLNGTISQFTYYPRRLTNTQLQNLTK